MKAIIDVDTIFGFWPKDNIDISLEKLLSVMEKQEVSQALAVSARAIFHDFVEGNDEVYRVSKAHPQIVPVAVVDLRKHFGCLDEVKKRKEQGFKLFRLYPNIHFPINYLPLFRFMDELNKQRMPVMINVEQMGDITQLASIVADLEIPIILDSCSWNNMAEAIVLSEDNPHVYIVSGRLFLSQGVEGLVGEIGAERLLFGSYAPLHCFSSSFKCVMEADISESDKAKILSGNAKRILELE